MKLFSINGEQALAAAKNHGTPCFVYDVHIAEQGFSRLRDALPRRVRLAYAVKANPHPSLLGAFKALDAFFDCASGGELERLRALGVPGEKILFAGPGKIRAEIGLALEMGARIQVDGIEDLEKIESLSAARGLTAGVNLRIHPKDMPQESSGIIGGSNASAFGVDEEDMADFLESAGQFAHVRLRGIQVFSASNELDADRLLLKHKVTLKIARAAYDYGMDVEEIDLGGGLGIPYAAGENEFDVARFGVGLGALLGQNPWFKGSLVIEPGRYLAGPCGVYLAGVTRVKSSRGERFAILEGGINHLARPLLVGQGFPVMSPDAAGACSTVTLAGPLCTSLDRLGTVDLPQLKPGNLLVFGQAGAYGFTEAMPLFLSRTPPKEIFL